MTESSIADLSFEVFNLVLEHLDTNNKGFSSDILEIQLTCKKLYQASAEKLYESVYIKCKQTATLFIQTLATSWTTRGMLVKNINFGKMLLEEEGQQHQDLLLLLLPIYRYCPNILEIRGLNNKTMLNSLMMAANSGLLTFLQQIPIAKHDSDVAGLYVDAALAFRKSLTQVEVYERPPLSADLLEQDNEMLSTRLGEFTNLKSLTITRVKNINNYNDMQFEVDRMIDSCPKLVEFSFNCLFPSIVQRQNSAVAANTTTISSSSHLQQIQSRPNIKTFSACGKVIENDNELGYIMQKFPKLDYLSVITKHNDSYDGPTRYSADAMTKFFEFMTNISSVHVEIILSGDEVVNVWINMMKSAMQIKNGIESQGGRITLDYNCKHPFLLNKLSFKKSTATLCIGDRRRLKTENDLDTTLFIPPFSNDTSYQTHLKMIENAGPIIQKLTVTQMENMQRAMARSGQAADDKLYGIWLNHIFANCSSLTNLILESPGYMDFHKHSSKLVLNKSLNLLSIADLQTVTADDEDVCNCGEMHTGDQVFNDISARLPCLEYLHLHNVYDRLHKNFTNIDMPYTSFDTFIWSRTLLPKTVSLKKWKIYIEIITTASNTNEEKKSYYVTSQLKINPSSKEVYNTATTAANSDKNYYIFICCKSIKHLTVKLKDDSKEMYHVNLEYNF
jgi:hypothetical protein